MDLVGIETRGLWLQWTLANLLGAVFGGTLGAIAELAFFDNTIIGPVGPVVIAGDQTVPLGLVIGAAASVIAESAGLRQRTEWGAQWVLTGLVILVAGGGALVATGVFGTFFDRPEALTMLIVLVLVIGASGGLTQLIILHGRVERAWWWPVASVAAWSASLLLGWMITIMVAVPVSLFVTRLLVDSLVGGVVGATIQVAAIVTTSGFLLGPVLKLLLEDAAVE